MTSAPVIVALGSNLGDSPRILLRAMARLEELSLEPLRKSSLWRTAPVNCPPGSPMFVNAVVALKPQAGETPERPLDLDLIAFGDEARATEQLALPHPRAHERGFVLRPLCEIAPDFIFPGQSKTVSQLLADLPPDECMRRLERSTDSSEARST